MSRLGDPSIAYVDYESVHRFLQIFGTTTDELPSSFFNLWQILHHPFVLNTRSNIEIRIAAQEIVSKANKQLSRLYPPHADILNRRFIQPFPQTSPETARALGIKERQLWSEQKKAIESLTQIINEKEIVFRDRYKKRMARTLTPQPLHQLVGIDEAVDELFDMLQNEERGKLLLLTGIGGLGKSTLADSIARKGISSLQYQSVLRLEIATGYISAAQLQEQLINELLSIEEGEEPRSQADLLGELTDYLQTVPHLVLIDGLEGEIDEVIDFCLLLAGRTRFIITSRQESLNKTQIYSYALSPLSIENAYNLMLVALPEHVGENSDSLPTKADFEPIYQKIGGNPLAIKLVAGLVDEMSLVELFEELRLVQHVETDRVYRRIYDQIWNNLHKQSKQILICLALFRSTRVTPLMLLRLSRQPDQESQEITPRIIRDILNDLKHRSLLEVSGSVKDNSYRYGIHSLTQTYLHSEVISWPAVMENAHLNGTYSPLEFIRQGIVNWKNNLDRFEDQTLSEPELLLDLNSINEITDLGLNWASVREDAVELLLAVRTIFYRHGYYDLLGEQLIKAIDMLEEDDGNPHMVCRLRNRLGQHHRIQGRYVEALNLHLAIRRQVEGYVDMRLIAETEFQLAEDYYYLRRYSEAFEAGKDALRKFEGLNNVSRWMSSVKNTLGIICLELKAFHQSVLYFKEAIELAEETEDLHEQGRYLQNLGRTYRLMDEPQLAIEALEKAIAHRVNNQLERCEALNELAVVYMSLGKFDETFSLLIEADNETLRLSNNSGIKRRINHNLGYASFRLGNHLKAENYLKIALKLGNELEQAKTAGLLGELFLVQEMFDQAIPYYEFSASILTKYPEEGALLKDVNEELAMTKEGLKAQFNLNGPSQSEE